MAFFSCECSHPHARALSLFFPFFFGLFLLRRRFCCFRPPRCGTRLDSSPFRPFSLSSRRYAFGRSDGRTHLRWRRFCCLRPPWCRARLDGSPFELFALNSRRHAFGRSGRRAHLSAGPWSSTTFAGRSLAAWRRLVRSSRTAGAYDAATCEYAGLRCGSNGRTAAVYSRPLPGVTSGNLHLLPLRAGERGTSLTGRGQLFRSGANGNAAWAVETGAGWAHVADGPAVNGRDVRHVDVIYCAVVIEPAAAPIASIVAVTGVAIAVVNAAVKAHYRSPIAVVPDKHAVAPCPIARSP